MKNLLIVDDLSQNLYLLEILLQTNGYAVQKAANGVEALEIAHQAPPDMIISDILMPTMDGFNLCRACKVDDQLKEIPFIFYTATYTDARDEEFALSLGADRFLIKPMETDAFLAALQEIFELKESKQPVMKGKLIEKEDEFNKIYKEALIRKLEDKMIQLEKSNRRLTSLYQVSAELHTVKSFVDLINIFLNAIIKIFNYQYAFYYHLNENKKDLTLQSTTGLSTDTSQNLINKSAFPVGQKKGLVGMVAQNMQTVNIRDCSSEPDWINFDPEIQSALFTSVHFERNSLGVIGLFSKEKNAFTEEDENDVATLANNLAIAIENCKNQEQVKKQLTRISTLHNIDIAINSSMDLHITLNFFIKQVTTQLKVDAADILLSHIYSPNFEFSAGIGFTSELIENNNIRSGRSPDKLVTIERQVVRLTGVNNQGFSSDFVNMWKKEGFSVYFGVPLIAKGKVVGVLEVFNREQFSATPEWLDYFETLAGQAAIAIDNAIMLNDLQRSNGELSFAYDATIKGWSRAMDLRDEETEGHTQRVTEMAVHLAELLAVDSDQIVHIRRGALLHDIGKLGVPDSILLKPGKLTDEEWEIMRKHPQFAYDLLFPINYLHPALDIPHYHHEKWDGTGYPVGLKGEEIPLAARLFAIVDVYDALRSDRSYRKAWPEEKTLDYIHEQSGKHFDPEIVRKFMKHIIEK